MLIVNSIDLHYGAAQVLRGVSLAAEAGKVTCVLGRNGVGKTSLLRALVGQHPISKGTTSFGGREAGSGKSWVIEIFRDSVRFRRKHCENKTASGGWEYSVFSFQCSEPRLAQISSD